VDCIPSYGVLEFWIINTVVAEPEGSTQLISKPDHELVPSISHLHNLSPKDILK
jgi:hypothetical protein